MAIVLKSRSRRDFLKQSGIASGGLILEALSLSAAFPLLRENAKSEDLQRRIFGKTGMSVSPLSLDTTLCGMSSAFTAGQIADIVRASLDQGINCIDAAPFAGNSEEGVGKALSRRRDIILSTKIWADTPQDAERSLAASLRALKTDFVDVLYYHNLGTRDFNQSTGPDGVFTWLLKQKKAGKVRFVGISGCNMSERFPDYIRTNQVDVIMMVLNFVDRNVYAFEKSVLPLAREYNLGIAAMKVFGGVRGGLGAVLGQKTVPQMPEEHLELALRYVLSLPGVATANISVCDVGHLRRNVEIAGNSKPLTFPERDFLEKTGRRLAARWRPYFGPISHSSASA
jgi:predicted aldo/keto reductase-like oxidoreductase